MTSCVSLGFAAAVACSSTEKTNDPLDVQDDDGGKKRDTGGTSSSSGSPDTDGGDSVLEGGATAGRVYAHTRDTLYLFEPTSKKLTEIGKFDCMNGDDMIDIALDRAGAMYGTGFHKFVSIDPSNAKCQLVSELTDGGYYPNSLSFIPIGALDATKEALVGYRQFNTDSQSLFEDYMRIDPTTGDIQQQGNLNPAAGTNGVYFDVSGDLIALSKDNNRAYAIVRPDQTLDAGALAKDTDYLAEINPSTGEIKSILGPTSQWETYGFGYWAGKGYGFSSDGRVTAIDMTTGKTTDVLTLDGGGGWYGAGVTTDSPVQ